MGEWRTGSLSEIAEIVMGQSPDGESSNTGRSGLPLLNGPTEFGTRSPVPVQYTTDPRKTCKIGDILFCVRGSTTGRMNWADQVYAIGRGIAALRHKSGSEFQYYLRAVLDYNLPTLLQAATGSTFPNVCFSDLDELEIEIPLEYEQRAIASVFSLLDDKIDLLHRQNNTLETMAETLFRKWFVEESSEKIKLGDAIAIFDSKRVPLSSLERDRMKVGPLYPYYGAATIMDHVNEYLFDGEYLLMGEDGTVQTEDGFPILQLATGKFWVNNHAHVFQAKPPYSIFVLYIGLRKTNISHLVTGAVQPKINQENLKSIELPFGAIERVREFESITGGFWQKIKSNNQQVGSLVRLRDLLLPKLMSGVVRVKS